MRSIIIFSTTMIVISIIAVVLMFCGFFDEPLAQLALLLGWIDQQLPVPKKFPPISMILFFILLRMLLLPYMLIYTRINRSTGEVNSDFEIDGSRYRSTKWLKVRWAMVLIINTAFYFAVLCATQYKMAGWNPEPKPDDEWHLLLMWINPIACGFIFVSIGACFTSAILCDKMGKCKAIGIKVYWVHDPHDTRKSLEPCIANIYFIFAMIDAITCGFITFSTWFIYDTFGGGYPYLDNLTGSYMVAFLISTLIWTAASVFMTWRDDRWVASLVRKSKEAVDPAVRQAAAAKLAKLGPWAPK